MALGQGEHEFARLLKRRDLAICDEDASFFRSDEARESSVKNPTQAAAC